MSEAPYNSLDYIRQGVPYNHDARIVMTSDIRRIIERLERGDTQEATDSLYGLLIGAPTCNYTDAVRKAGPVETFEGVPLYHNRTDPDGGKP